MTILKPMLSASLLCFCLAGSAFADDSTNITGPNVTTVMPQAVVDQNNCVVSSVIIAVTGTGQQGTDGQKTAICPAGYVAEGMTSNVTPQIFQGYEYQWTTNCCKAIVEYPSVPSG